MERAHSIRGRQGSQSRLREFEKKSSSLYRDSENSVEVNDETNEIREAVNLDNLT